MDGRLDSPRVSSRRRLLAGALALAFGPTAMGAAPAAAATLERRLIATIRIEQGLAPPVTLGMARVVLRPGAAAWAAIPGGVRIISVESGLLGVATAPLTNDALSVHDLTVATDPPRPTEELVLPAGTTMTFGASGVASVRNSGSRAAVLLDAAVFTEEPRPLARAFTTTSGVSFQLLASASAASLPAGPLDVALERLRLGAAQAAPDDVSQGLALTYIEAGTLWLEATAGVVSWARAAASAPYAQPGAMKPLAAGEAREATAGGVIFLAQDARMQLTNAGRRPAEILTLAAREAVALAP